MYTRLISVSALALILAACSGSTRFEGDLAEQRNCQIPDDEGFITLAGFDPSERNPQTAAEQSAAYLDVVREGTCVFETESGLLYRIRRASQDGASPISGEMVTVHYRGLHPNGEAFNDSYALGDPATFDSSRLIGAWVEALPMMRVGEEWELYVDPSLGYRERGTPGGPIGPNEALIFTLELLAVPSQESESEDEAG